MENQEKNAGFPLLAAMLGASFGALVGVAVGMLVAPRSGDETRRRIGLWTREKRLAGAEMVAGIKDQTLRKMEAVKAAMPGRGD